MCNWRNLLVVTLTLMGGVYGAFAGPMIQDLDWSCVSPTYAIAGDFNGDGWDDIAIACHSCDSIFVGLNPTGTPCPVAWGDPKVFGLGDSPTALAWGLFGRGVGPYTKKIVAVTQYRPGWSAFTVTSSASLSALNAVTAIHVIVGDFNGDGSLDVAVLDPLGLKVTFPTGGIADIDLSDQNPGAPAFMAAGDFDRDADLDLVISSSTSLLFYENDGCGGFTRRLNIRVGLSLRGIAVGDFDGDADEDLAVVDPKFGALAIIRNDGCWNFTISAKIKMDKGPVFVLAFDCDRDGDLDLAVAEYDGDSVSMALNSGMGSFSIRHRFAVGKNPVGLDVGDFDRNGIPDLVIALHGGGPEGEGPAAQVIYNPCCATDDCTKQAPCCGEGTSAPASCGGS